MRRPRTRRVIAAVIVTVVGVTASQALRADAAERRVVDVAVAQLDSAGYPLAVTLNEFTRTYNDSGSKDKAGAKALTLRNGLLNVNGKQRALPVVVRTRYFLNGSEVSAKEISGKAGDFKVEWNVTNRSQKTQKITYTDSVTGKEKTVTAATMVPFTVTLDDLTLSDATFDNLSSNGVVSRNAENTASKMGWTAVLAPPVFPGTAKFSLEGATSDFKLPDTTIVAVPGVAGALPASASDAAEKGGASAATLRGYVTKFGDGFGQLSGGLGLLKGGVDQIFTGLDGTLKPALKNPTFDPAKYAEDGTLADNQPGLIQALEVLGGGLGSLMDAAAQVRGGLSTGDNAAPGVLEGLNQVVGAVGLGNEFDGSGNPLTLRASLNAIRVGLASGDANEPGMVEGLQKIVAAIGTGSEFAGSTPLTLRASINAVRAGLSSGDANNPKVIEGLEQIFDSIGDGSEFAGTTPLTVAAGLAAIHGSLSSGDLNNPMIVEGLQQIYASIGDGSEFAGTTPLTVAASLVGVRAALSSGDVNNPAILEGLQKIYAGIGAGNEFSGTTPLTVAASLNAIRAALSNTDLLNPGMIQAIEQVVAGIGSMKANLNAFNGAFSATVSTALTDLLLPGLLPAQDAVVAGVVDTFVDATVAGLDQMAAGLSSGDMNNPAVLEGLQTIYGAIGDGTEFSGSDPLTVAASMVAMRAGLSSGDANNPKIIEGVQKIYDSIGLGSEFSGTTPLTIRAALEAMKAGLSSGDVNNPKIIEGLQKIYAALGEGDEFTSGIPTSLRASLNAIRAGLKSGDVNNPKIIEGLQTMYAALGNGTEFAGAVPLTLQAGLVALSQGAAQLEGGAQLVHDSIGSGAITEFGPDGSPMTVQAGLVAATAGLSKLAEGIEQIAAGMGDVDETGKAVKAVTTRVSKYGNTLESPASLLYALDVSKEAVLTKFVVGVGQIIDALGDPKVPTASILFGLKQVSDGLASAGGGGAAGADGAATVAKVLNSTVAAADIVTALHQAGGARAEHFNEFNENGDGKTRTVFVLRLGGVS